MAEYKAIKGLKITTVASDPSPATVGQMWYDTATNNFKYTGKATAWAAGGDLVDGRQGGAGAGSITAALYFGGNDGTRTNPSDAFDARTEEYNGTGWTEVADLNLGRENFSGTGTTSAALACGGFKGDPTATGYLSEVEEWNGASWTAVNHLTVDVALPMSAGTTSAAVAAGGQNQQSPYYKSTSQEWNGTSWTAGNSLVAATSYTTGGGTMIAALMCGGALPGATANVQAYDGTTWTEVNNLNTARQQNSTQDVAPTSSFLTFGGNPGPTAVTEEYNGTSWTEIADLATARGDSSGAGTTSDAALCIGGTPFTTATEVFSLAETTKTVTAS